jgi:uncharacterized membrane protein (DUF4010 family)
VNEDPFVLAVRFAAALGLGVFLGLERERKKQAEENTFAGVRTIGLIALTGAVAAYLATQQAAPWLAVAVFAAVASLVVVSYWASASRGELGITTEISALLAFLLGYLCVFGQIALAAGLAVASGAVLALKEGLHRLAGRIEPADVEATLKFAIVSLIVLPLVPDQSYGPAPFDVLNPHEIWLMVVLISGLNFASYVLVKVLGAEHGIGVTGLLGGLVSSTAVTLGFSQRSRQEPRWAAPLALGILIAWSVMFVRVLVMAALVTPALAARLALAIAVIALPCLLIALWLLRRQQTAGKANVAARENPFELGAAIRFGLLFGLVTLAARAAQVYLGNAGLYAAGALAGLTDVDAITLSMASLARDDPGSLSVAARTVVIAVLSNTLVKGGMTLFLGAPELRRVMAPAVGVILLAGAVSAFLL